MKKAKPYLTITGQITETGAGPAGADEKVVYQRCGAGFGNLPGNGTYNMQRRRYVKPTNTVTPELGARRIRLANGVTAWRETTPEEKQQWRSIGASSALPAYNAFLRAWMKAYVPPPYGWDKGLTTWDAGASLWDGAAPTMWDYGAAEWDAGASMWDTLAETSWDAGATTWDAGATIWIN